MKILSCSISGGDVCAAILAEKEDCARYGGGHAAVEGCIELFRREKELSALALVRVTRLEERRRADCRLTLTPLCRRR